ncbi:MAG: PAS domain-containing protein, partial [Terriglobales bacterium]
GRSNARRVHWIRILDFAQVGIVISAAYLYFLYYLPLSGAIRQDILSVSNDVYSVLDLCVLGGFVLRAAFTPAGAMRSMFARMTAVFLAYCIGSALYGHALVTGAIPGGGTWLDLVWSLPFVIATIGIATWKPGAGPSGVADNSARTGPALLLLPTLAPVLVLALAYHIYPVQEELALLIGVASFSCALGRLALTQLRQRIALQALRTMERKFSRAFRSAPDSMTISTLREGRYLAVNDRFTELFGFHREEVIGKTAPELGIWADPGERSEFIEQLARQERIRDREVTFCAKSGQQFHAQISAETVELGGEQCLVAGVRDIIERKRAEEALLRSEARYRELVQSAVYGIYRATMDGKILYANPALVKMLGYESVREVLRLNT